MRLGVAGGGGGGGVAGATSIVDAARPRIGERSARCGSSSASVMISKSVALSLSALVGVAGETGDIAPALELPPPPLELPT